MMLIQYIAPTVVKMLFAIVFILIFKNQYYLVLVFLFEFLYNSTNHDQNIVNNFTWYFQPSLQH